MPEAPQTDPVATIWETIRDGTDHGEGASYLLHEGQVEVRETFLSAEGLVFVVCCARRFGKSLLCVVLAVEQAVRVAGSIVLYAAPTAKQVRTIVIPHMRRVLADVPLAMRPKYSTAEGAWVFPNGSLIRAAGCDKGNAELLRGAEAHLAIADEAGFIDDLEYVVQDILLPQTITTGGHVLLPSTPSRTPAHDFMRYCEAAEAEGNYVHKTIYEAPHISDAQRAQYAKESGGVESSTWKREYLAKFVVDEESAIVPEFTRHEEAIVIDIERPPYFHAYVMMDQGYTDLTAALFGYLHFELAALVIEDEKVFKRQISKVIDAGVLAKERELWSDRRAPVGHRGDVWEPEFRVVDAPLQVVADLGSFHGTAWLPAEKDDAAGALNVVRLRIADHTILINPRCKTLISHLRHGIWNKSRTSFERSGDFGHFDAIDALKYGVRAIPFALNPYPPLWEGQVPETHWIRKSESRSQGVALRNALMGRK